MATDFLRLNADKSDAICAHLSLVPEVQENFGCFSASVESTLRNVSCLTSYLLISM